MKSVKLQMEMEIVLQQLFLCVIDKIVSTGLCFYLRIKLLKYLFGAINKRKDYKQCKLSATKHGRTARTGAAGVCRAPRLSLQHPALLWVRLHHLAHMTRTRLIDVMQYWASNKLHVSAK